MSNAEDSLATLIRWEKLPEPSREYVFAKPRRWRFDFAWWPQKVAMEVEGGSWIAGRHTRGSSFEADCEKYDEAALAGWIVLRVTPHMIEDGRAIALIRRALEPKEPKIRTVRTLWGEEPILDVRARATRTHDL